MSVEPERTNNLTITLPHMAECCGPLDIDWVHARAIYQRYQLLHLKRKYTADGTKESAPSASSNDGSVGLTLSRLQDLFRDCPEIVKDSWNVENPGDRDDEDIASELCPERVFKRDEPRPERSWYCSCILQAAREQSVSVLDTFLSLIPVIEPACFSRGSPRHHLQSTDNGDDRMDAVDVTHTKGMWFFCGQHLPPVESQVGGKRAREMSEDVVSAFDQSGLLGRAEHTDSLDHTGTWHFQASGEKIWHLRPCEDHSDWAGQAPTILDMEEHKQSSLSVRCEEGDILLINTRLWWHRTEIPYTHHARDKLSISYARDFNSCTLDPRGVKKVNSLSDSIHNEIEKGKKEKKHDHFSNMDGVYASRNVKKGDIVLTEDELPGCSLPRCLDCNCEVVEIEAADGRDDGVMALRAVKDISAGEWLTVAPSDDEDEDDDEDNEDEDGYDDDKGGDDEDEDYEDEGGDDEDEDGDVDEDCQDNYDDEGEENDDDDE